MIQALTGTLPTEEHILQFKEVTVYMHAALTGRQDTWRPISKMLTSTLRHGTWSKDVRNRNAVTRNNENWHPLTANHMDQAGFVPWGEYIQGHLRISSTSITSSIRTSLTHQWDLLQSLWGLVCLLLFNNKGRLECQVRSGYYPGRGNVARLFVRCSQGHSLPREIIQPVDLHGPPLSCHELAFIGPIIHGTDLRGYTGIMQDGRMRPNLRDLMYDSLEKTTSGQVVVEQLYISWHLECTTHK